MLSRRARAGVAAVTAVLVALAGPATTATSGPSAGTAKPCVTKKEFGAVKQGWTPRRVADAFGTQGKRVTVAQFSEVRRYAKCSDTGQAIVNYERKAAGRPLGLASKYW